MSGNARKASTKLAPGAAGEGQGAAAEVTEHEGGAGLGGAFESEHRLVESQDPAFDPGELQKSRDQRKLEREARDNDPPREGPPLLAYGPRQRDEDARPLAACRTKVERYSGGAGAERDHRWSNGH